MDFRAVLIFLCLHTAHATIEQEKNDALNQTISKMQSKILKTLGDLNELSLSPNEVCLNSTTLASLEQQPLTTKPLCLFLCYLSRMPKLTPEIADDLLDISQHIQDIMDGCTAYQDCSLPKFEGSGAKLCEYMFPKYLLELLHERLKTV